VNLRPWPGLDGQESVGERLPVLEALLASVAGLPDLPFKVPAERGGQLRLGVE